MLVKFTSMKGSIQEGNPSFYTVDFFMYERMDIARNTLVCFDNIGSGEVFHDNALKSIFYDLKAHESYTMIFLFVCDFIMPISTLYLVKFQQAVHLTGFPG